MDDSDRRNSLIPFIPSAYFRQPIVLPEERISPRQYYPPPFTVSNDDQEPSLRKEYRRPSRQKNSSPQDSIEPGDCHRYVRPQRSQNVKSTLEKKNESCVVCLDKPKDHVLVPCGHVCLCKTCTVPKCPICRHAVRMKMKIFLA